MIRSNVLCFIFCLILSGVLSAGEFFLFNHDNLEISFANNFEIETIQW